MHAVRKMEEYVVRLSGLEDGTHAFEFTLDDSFFATFDFEEIKHGGVKAQVQLDKKPGMVTLGITLKGEVTIMCDRCLEDYRQPVDQQEEIYFKYGDHHEELEDNVVVIPRDEHQINIAQYLYEFTVLSLPLKKVHPDRPDGSTGCDPDMVKKLNDLEIEQGDQETDPRWNELKKIIEKNN